MTGLLHNCSWSECEKHFTNNIDKLYLQYQKDSSLMHSLTSSIQIWFIDARYDNLLHTTESINKVKKHFTQAAILLKLSLRYQSDIKSILNPFILSLIDWFIHWFIHSFIDSSNVFHWCPLNHFRFSFTSELARVHEEWKSERRTSSHMQLHSRDCKFCNE